MDNTATISKKHAKTGAREAESSLRVADVSSRVSFSGEAEMIALSPRDQMKVFETLKNPPPLNEAMKKALEKELERMYVHGE